MVRTEIGECAITHGNMTYEFRPSFKNIRKICHPSGLASLYADLAGVIDQKIAMAKSIGLNGAVYMYLEEIRDKAATVMASCCDSDCSSITNNKQELPTKAMQQLALSLLTHGVIGVVKNDGGSKKEKRDNIDVYEYADIAEAHLGIAYPLSENLTKTELDRKLNVKFPPQDKTNGAPSDDEYYKAMEMLDKIDKKKRAK